MTVLLAGELVNYKLTTLDLRGCDITLTGAKSLATSLQLIQREIIVNLCDNPITIEGAHLTLQSAVESTAGVNVWVDSDYKIDENVSEMLNILDERRKLN